MDSTPSPAAPDDAPDSAWLKWGRPALLTLITWLSFMNFPTLPPLGLDPSWRMALSYFTTTDLQFGRDIVFTAGPLGYLLSSSATGINYWHHLVWQYGVNLVFALGIVGLSRPLHGLRLLCYYLFFWALLPVYMDALQVVLVAAAMLAFFLEEVRRCRFLITIIGTALAALALVKFTNLLLAVAGVGILSAWLAWNRNWRELAWTAGSCLVAFLFGWMAWGQQLGNLPAYILNSLSVSSGYLDSMGVQEPHSIFLAGLTTALALGFYWILFALRAEDKLRGMAIALVGLAASLLSWKHGFVRADGHVLAFFYMVLFFAVTHGLWTPLSARWRRLHLVGLLIVSLAALRGIGLLDSTKLTDFAEFINTRLRDNLTLVLHTPQLASDARADYLRMQQGLRLPTVRALAGRTKRVDLLGCDVGFAIVNELNYRPRPTIQGYVAMNPHLAQLNEDFMADPARAPEVVLYRIESIDDRLPTLDDSRAIRYLFHHYEFLLDEGGFMLFSRANSDPTLDQRELISEETYTFGQVISTPVRGNQPVWCEIEIKPTLTGRLRRFFYKPPAVKIHTDDGGSDQRSFLLPPPMAAAGFPVYPYFTNHQNVAHYQAGNLAPRLMRFSLSIDPTLAGNFDDNFSVRFYALPPYPRRDPSVPLPKEVLYRAFNRIPDRTEGPNEAITIDDGENVRLLVHTPSTLTFELDGTETEVSGVCGLLPGAYTGENYSDGAEFRLEWISADQTESQVLWQRSIDPRQVPSDRGDLRFAVKLPASRGTLNFITGPGPLGSPAFDWVYWAEVDIK